VENATLVVVLMAALRARLLEAKGGGFLNYLIQLVAYGPV